MRHLDWLNRSPNPGTGMLRQGRYPVRKPGSQGSRRPARRLSLESCESREVLASIAGVVYVDVNANNVRDTNESGVPGVQMSILGTGDEVVTRSLLTGSDGTFLFSDLPAGTYRLRQQQPSSLSDGQESTSVTGATVGSDEISNIVLTADQNATGNNFAERSLVSDYISIGWFFASSRSVPSYFREVVALGEERAGKQDLADSIRAGEDDAVVPPTSNTPPVAANDSYSIARGLVLTVPVATGLLANDSDANQNAITAVVATNPTNGGLVLNTDGSFTYTPNTNFSGTDTFTYTARDASSTSNVATVTITVTATPNSFSIPENSAVNTLVGQVQPASGDVEDFSYSLQNASLNADLVPRLDDHLTGDPAATMLLIEYIDLQDADSADLEVLVQQLETEFEGELAVIRRHRPDPTARPNSLKAAIAAEAAGKQDAFEDMMTLLFDSQDEWAVASDANTIFLSYADELGLDVDQFETDLDDPALAQRVQRDRDAATRLGITATPAYYLNGERLSLDDVTDDFAEIIEDALADFSGTFKIDRTTGELLVAAAEGLDFETQPSWPLVVQTTNASGTSSTVNVTVSLTNVNESSPVAFADSYTVVQNSPLTVDVANGVLKNDTDGDRDSLTAQLIGNPTSGSVTLNANGSFVYTPATGFTGTTTFTYLASDGTRTSSPATVTLTVNSSSSGIPVATADVYTGFLNQTLTVDAATGVLFNDTDPNNDQLTAQLVTTTTSGTLTLNGNGSFTYAPNQGFSGTDTFTYRASDGSQTSALTTVTLTINSVNSAPTATNDTYTVPKAGTLNVTASSGVLANDDDADDNPLTTQLVTTTTHGTLTLNPNGSFSYTPDLDYVGSDTFSYRANDGSATSAVATVTISVTDANLSPVAVADAFSLDANARLLVLVGEGVLKNDTDLNGDTLTAQLVTTAANGSLTLNANGSFEYLPNAGFVGTDTFTYRVSDSQTTSAPATVTLTVSSLNVLSVLENTANGTLIGRVTPTDSQLSGSLIYEWSSPQASSQLRLQPDDHFQGDPKNANVLIVYLDFQSSADRTLHENLRAIEASDANDLLVVRRHLPKTTTNTSSLQAAQAAEAAAKQGKFDEMVDLLFQNQAAWSVEANPQQLFQSFAATLSLNATQYNNDFINAQVIARINRDVQTATSLNLQTTPALFLNGSPVSPLPNSQTSLQDLVTSAKTANTEVLALDRTNGDVYVRLATGLDFETTPRLVRAVTVSDADGTVSQVTATVQLVDVANEGPVAVADSYVLNEDAVLNVSSAGGVLSNDTGGSLANPIAAELVTGTQHGTLALSPSGSFVYTPVANYNGSDSFTYRVMRGSQVSTATTVSLVVAAIGDAPVAVSDSYTVTENQVLAIAAADGVLKNDTDVEGGTLVASLLQQPAHGTIIVSANGSFEYTPAQDYVGPDEFRYTVSDGTLTGEGTVTITVTAASNAAVAAFLSESSDGARLAAIDAVFADEGENLGEMGAMV